MSRPTITAHYAKALPLIAIILLGVCISIWKVRGAGAANVVTMTPMPAGTTLFVTNTNDSGPGSLRAAITTANSDTVADTIEMNTSGTINLLSALPAFSERSVVIDGPGADALRVRRNGEPGLGFRYSIFTINEGVTVSINGLTISHGYSSSGGGILNSGALTLNNCVVSNSLADTLGGGIYNGTTGTLTLNDSTISQNEVNRSAEVSQGGGIINFGQLTINRTNISQNRAAEGGGLYNAYNPSVASIVNITNSTVDHNSASTVQGQGGGGIFSAGVLTVTSSTIEHNGASGDGGGLTINATSGDVTLTETAIQDNVAARNGGGIKINLPLPAAGPIKLDRVTISTNFGTQGGGIYNAGKVSLDNCTISTNDGAGIITANNSTTIVNQSTVTGNIGSFQGGAGIDGQLAPVTVSASIISGNRANSVVGDIKGSIVSNDFNLLGAGATNSQLKPHDIVATDPKLTTLGLYGGKVQTHALLPESPAIDHGPTSNFLLTDARNLPRPVDSDGDGIATADIGAFEAQQYVVTNTGNSGAGSLRQALLTNNSAGGGMITFDIPGDGVHTIAPSPNTLLEITKPVYLAGYSQPGASRNNSSTSNNATLLIEINGTTAGFGAAGLNLTAGYSVIEGLVINGFTGNAGISISGTGATKNRLSGNRIGTDPMGTLSRPNAYAVLISAAPSNLVGSNGDGINDITEGNLLSGNSNGGVGIFDTGSTANVVAGNYIGVDASGQNALSNAGNGIVLSGAGQNVIGGPTSATRNIVSGNTQNGISVDGANTNNLIVGNFIGTNVGGTVAISNGAGIHLFNGTNTRIGGTTTGEGNVISGNKEGVIIGPDGAANNLILGNLIGLASDGSSPLGNNNGNGVSIINASGNSIGDPTNPSAANRIAFNSGSGVYVFSGTANNIRGNSIFGNSALAIDLGPAGVTPNDDGDGDSGANNLQNYPLLSSVLYDEFTGSRTEIAGTLKSTPNTTFSLEFFDSPICGASGHGEGRTLIGTNNVTTDASGNISFDYNFPTANLVGHSVSVTATDSSGNTSEFSPCVVAVVAPRTVQFTSENFSIGEGSGVATLTVSRTGSQGGPVTVNYTTANSGAVGGAACATGVDYINTSGVLTWADNDLSPKTINVPICNDTSFENSENVSVTLSDATNGAHLGSPATATFTIQDNDDPGQISFAGVSSAREGYATATFSVSRTAVDGDAVSVQYATISGGTAIGGTACGPAGVNFINSTGTLSWSAGDVSPKSFTINLCDNTTPEPDKTLVVGLSNATGGASLGSPSTSTLNIVDDDHIYTVTNTNDDGPGSLRQAVVTSNLNEPTDSNHINLNGLSGTINLLTALPVFNANIFIHGPRANLLTVARSSAPGTPEFGIFSVNSGRKVSIGGLTIRNGIADSGGGIYSEGTTAVEGCNIEGNTASGGGGGIANVGAMTLNASTIANNRNLFVGNIAGGAGIFNGGSLHITNSTVSGNISDPTEHGHGYGGGIFNDSKQS